MVKIAIWSSFRMEQGYGARPLSFLDITVICVDLTSVPGIKRGTYVVAVVIKRVIIVKIGIKTRMALSTSVVLQHIIGSIHIFSPFSIIRTGQRWSCAPPNYWIQPPVFIYLPMEGKKSPDPVSIVSNPVNRERKLNRRRVDFPDFWFHRKQNSRVTFSNTIRKEGEPGIPSSPFRTNRAQRLLGSWGNVDCSILDSPIPCTRKISARQRYKGVTVL